MLALFCIWLYRWFFSGIESLIFQIYEVSRHEKLGIDEFGKFDGLNKTNVNLLIKHQIMHCVK